MQPLISAAALAEQLKAGATIRLLDCSFDLVDTTSGERRHASGHLPGAVYAHLERDLSGPKHPAGPRSPAFTGRHPLPDRAAFAGRVGEWGIGPATTVVCYDGEGGPYAARCWWLLRWLGHERVAVLDGGSAAWVAAGGVLVTDAVVVDPVPPYPLAATATMPWLGVDEVLGHPVRPQIVDARTGERFRGETEPLDPVAGHIPGALNRFFKDNLGADGRFKPAARLRAEFAALGVSDGATVLHQCGSGVTACHNLLAMEVAGLVGSALYPGSWSEWCADATRPVARG